MSDSLRTGFSSRASRMRAALRALFHFAAANISFTSPGAIHTFAGVRGVIASSLVLLGSVALVSAQEQERKMLDRLLKPDMTLQNNAQGKRFVADGAKLTKNAPTKSFYVTEVPKQKRFWNTRSIAEKPFATESSRFARAEANLSTRNQIPKLDTRYATADYSGVREAADAQKAMATSDFAGNRTFEGRGKSQKSLSAQDRRLTIDEVRELLNKNK